MAYLKITSYNVYYFSTCYEFAVLVIVVSKINKMKRFFITLRIIMQLANYFSR